MIIVNNSQYKRFLAFIFLFTSVLFGKSQTWEGQRIFLFAGTWGVGFSGDSGVAYLAKLNSPFGVTADATGNVYIADCINNRIRKVNVSGIISTFAGTGVAGFSGDGGLATSAQLYGPSGVAVDANGNVYVADKSNARIRKINPAGIISTFAGTGVLGFGGDGGPAINADFMQPWGLAVDVLGNVYIADRGTYRVRIVNPSGIISNFAGTGAVGNSGDGGPAINAQFASPIGVTVDGFGNVYIADQTNHRIRKINASGIISNYAGTGIAGFSGNGGSAITAQLNFPAGIAIDAAGNGYIPDYYNNLIRKVNSLGIISTFAGTGAIGSSGVGGNALEAQLNKPDGIAVDLLSGNVYFSEFGGNRVMVVCVSNCLSNINSLIENNDQVLIFPNPNNGSFKVQIENDIQNGEIILFNSLGQKVCEQKISKGENKIITNGLAKGLYNYILQQNKERFLNGKLAIE